MEKKKYLKPLIELIYLDNEISLALQSTPPAGPSETINTLDSGNINNTPFKS